MDLLRLNDPHTCCGSGDSYEARNRRQLVSIEKRDSLSPIRRFVFCMSMLFPWSAL